MPIDAGTVTLDVEPDVSSFGKKLSDRITKPVTEAGEKAGHGFSEGFARAHDGINAFAKKVAIAAAAGGAGLAVFGTKAVLMGSDLNESLGKSQVVFGQFAAGIEEWSKGAADAMGITQQQALEASGTFGNLFRALGIGQKPAADMSTKLVGLASDLASFNNADPTEVLQALQSGLVGEAEPLRKFGVSLSEARIQQEAVREGLIKSVKDGLTPAQKAQAAYSIIMQDTALAQGDFARTSGGLANQMRILKARFGTWIAQVGQKMIPIVLGGIKWLGHLKDQFGRLINVIRGGDDVAQGVAEIIDNIFGNSGMLVGPIRTAIEWGQKIVGFVKDNLAPVLAAIGTVAAVAFAAWAIGAAQAAVATLAATWPILAIGAALAALAFAVTYAYKHWSWFHTAVDATGRFLRDKAWPAIKWFTARVVEGFMGVVHWFQTNWPGIQAAIGKTVAWIQTNVVPVVSAVVEALIGFFQRLWGEIQTIWSGISTAISFAVGVVSTVFSGLQTVASVVWPYISSAIQFAWGLIKPIFELIANFAEQYVIGKFHLVQTVAEQVWKGVGVAVDLAWKVLEPIFGFISDKVGTALPVVLGGLKSAFEVAWEAIQKAVQIAWDIIRPVIDAIKSAIDSLKGPLDTLAGAAGKVGGFVGGVVGKIPGLAVGGPVVGGQPYVVGEHGPELFVSKTPGWIVPNHQLPAADAGGQGRGGGVSIGQVVVNDAADEDRFMRKLEFLTMSGAL